MIVIGVDAHKYTHTVVAVDAAGRQLDELTVEAREEGYQQLLRFAARLDIERIWAVEDCRHVSAGLERFLAAAGERVVRVPPKLMGESRKGERSPGKSDAIDAVAVARAALRQGIGKLPVAKLDPDAHAIKLLVDHREDLVQERTRIQSRLRWHLHELWPDFEIPKGGLDRAKWLDIVARRLRRAEQSVRVDVCRDQLRRLRELTRRCAELERELTTRVRAKAPQLLELSGCGALSAARLIGETAGATLPTDAKLARLAGVAPIPASSGNRRRHRLHRGGNRQLNCALHRIAVTQGRVHGPARDYLARKQAEGKTRIEALRCHKRQLARRVWHLLQMSSCPPTPTPAMCGVGLT